MHVSQDHACALVDRVTMRLVEPEPLCLGQRGAQLTQRDLHLIEGGPLGRRRVPAARDELRQPRRRLGRQRRPLAIERGRDCGLQRQPVGEGHLVRDQLKAHHAEGVDVGALAVALVPRDLGGHPAQRARLRRHLTQQRGLAARTAAAASASAAAVSASASAAAASASASASAAAAAARTTTARAAAAAVAADAARLVAQRCATMHDASMHGGVVPLAHLDGHAEVGQLDDAATVDEHVGALEVAVHDAPAVQVGHARRDAVARLERQAGRRRRAQRGAQVAARAVLEHEAVRRRLDHRTHVLHHVWVAQLRERRHLGAELCELGDAVARHLDRHRRAAPPRLVGRARRADAHALDELELVEPDEPLLAQPRGATRPRVALALANGRRGAVAARGGALAHGGAVAARLEACPLAGGHAVLVPRLRLDKAHQLRLEQPGVEPLQQACG
eukprot:scaffold1817_cov63-Phaeocystis_antarctica.AAC.4